MNWIDFVNDPGSTTKAFKLLTTDYKLEILSSNFTVSGFERIIVIKLDKIPVMVAISTTSHKDCLFLDILKNAENTPIGVKLFEQGSSIKRGNMSVTPIKINKINSQVIKQYILQNVVVDTLYLRRSSFTCRGESMELSEYVLPGLKQIFDKYNFHR